MTPPDGGQPGRSPGSLFTEVELAAGMGRCLLEVVEEAFVAVDQGQCIVFFNRGAERLFGYAADEVLGAPLDLLLPLQSREAHRQHVAAFGASPDRSRLMNQRLPICGRRKDASEFPAEASIAKLEVGGQTLFAAFLRDITERRRAEEAIRASEQRYRLLVENARDVAYRFRYASPRGFEFVSPASTAVTGYAPEEYYADPSLGLRLLHPDDRARYATPEWAPASPIPVSRLVCKDGTVKWVEGRRTPYLDASGQVIAVEGFLRDVTDQVNADRAVREQKALVDGVLASAPRAMAVLGDDGRVLLVNPAFCQHFSVGPQEAQDRALEELPVPGAVVAAAREVARTGRPVESVDVEDTQAGGRRVWEVTIVPMTPAGAGGAPSGSILLSMRDVTQERAAQERMLHASRLATLGEMAAGVVHELNSPLTSVLGYAALLEQKDLPEPAKRDLDVIRQSAEHAASVVQRLLDFARPQPPKRTRVNLNRPVEAALGMRARELRLKNIEVLARLAEDLPETMADTAQMEQVFLNIVVNAEQAMEEAHGRGRLEVATAERGGYVTASFTDDGPGISPEHLAKLFTPFFTTKEPGKGTGLGLSICQRIVNDHGGQITAERRPDGHGASFTVWLPVAPETGLAPQPLPP